MRFAIYGSGGLGGFYGARLAQAGHDVGFIARGAHLEAMRSSGLKVLSPLGNFHVPSPKASSDPAEIGPVDVVIVAVKTWQVPEVARAMGPLLGKDTMVVPFLNGVDAPDDLAAVLGAARVIGGLSKVFSLIEAPGVIRQFNPGAYVEVGELGGGLSARVASLRDAFASAGVDSVASADIRSALWKKLLTVSSWAGLGALARSPIGVIRAQPETRALVDRAMDEGIAVGRKLGYTLEDGFKQGLWSFYDSLAPEATASMLRDIMAGKPSELDAWNGAVVRFGLQTSVATPVHTFTYHALLPMERRARNPE